MKTERPHFESVEQIAEATAAGLDEAATGHAFQLFRDNQLRRLAHFDRLSEGEQDRIFNELVVAHLVLVMLVLEAPDLRVPAEVKSYLVELKAAIPQAHVACLRKLGLAAEHQRDWETLIGLRYDEFAKDRHEVRAAAMKLESDEKDLDVDDLSKIQLLVPVQAVAIGCHHHICRGETDGRDELFKYVLRSLGKFYVGIRLSFEVGKITPLMRARAALRRLVRPD